MLHFAREYSLGIHEPHFLLLMAEILHQLISSFSDLLQGFIHPRCCRISSINSSKGQPDFFVWVILFVAVALFLLLFSSFESLFERGCDSNVHGEVLG